MIDYTVQRTNMVDSQVRTADVTDRRIIRAMLAVPREMFVPGALKSMAYMDEHLGVTEGAASKRVLLAPRTFAKLVQLLGINDGDRVLDVGCATGYSCAVLSSLAREVVGLEQDAVLGERARRTLAGIGCTNVVVRAGPLTAGVAADAPFDAILVNGCMVRRPEDLLAQLKDGGRLAGIEANGGTGQAVRWQRNGHVLDSRAAFDAGAPVLPGFEAEPGFVF